MTLCRRWEHHSRLHLSSNRKRTAALSGRAASFFMGGSDENRAGGKCWWLGLSMKVEAEGDEYMMCSLFLCRCKQLCVKSSCRVNKQKFEEQVCKPQRSRSVCSLSPGSLHKTVRVWASLSNHEICGINNQKSITWASAFLTLLTGY